MHTGPVVKTLLPTTTYNANTTVDLTNNFYGVSWLETPNFILKATEVNNGDTLNVYLQVSEDGGTTKRNIGQFTQLSATGNEMLFKGAISAAGNNGLISGSPFAQNFYMALVFGAGAYNWNVSLIATGLAARGSGK